MKQHLTDTRDKAATFRSAGASEYSELGRYALLTRDVIGQAKRILVEREHIDADHAFENRRSASRHLNIRVHNVANEVMTPEARHLVDGKEHHG